MKYDSPSYVKFNLLLLFWSGVFIVPQKKIVAQRDEAAALDKQRHSFIFYSRAAEHRLDGFISQHHINYVDSINTCWLVNLVTQQKP